MLLDPTSLSLFVAVAEEGSIAAAGRRAHIAAAAVSTRLAALEHALGTRLLGRTNRGIALTDAGRALVSLSRGVLHSLDDAAAQVRAIGSGTGGQVRVAANISALAQWLPGDIASFLRLHPQVEVHLEERISSATVRAVAENAADVGIFTGEFGEGLEVFPWRADRLALLAPRKHPLARRGRVAFADALAHDFIGLHTGSAINLLLVREATALNATLRLRIQVTSYDALCRMVGAGLGVGILPREVAAPYLKPLGLRALELAEPWARRELRIGVRSMAALTRGATLFVEHLRSRAAADQSRPPKAA